MREQQRGERSDEVGDPPSDPQRDDRSQPAPDDAGDRAHLQDLRFEFREAEFLAELARPKNDPLEAAPAAEERHRRERDAHESDSEVGLAKHRGRSRSAALHGLGRGLSGGQPGGRFRHEQEDQNPEREGTRSDEEHPAERVRGDRLHDEHGRKSEDADVAGHADHAGDDRTRKVRPRLGDQRHAVRPASSHAETCDETDREQLRRVAGEVGEPGESGEPDDGDAQRPGAPDAVAEPPENPPARCRAEQERALQVRRPPVNELAARRAFEALGPARQVQQPLRRRASEIGQPSLHAAEKPAEEGDHQDDDPRLFVECFAGH